MSEYNGSASAELRAPVVDVGRALIGDTNAMLALVGAEAVLDQQGVALSRQTFNNDPVADATIRNAKQTQLAAMPRHVAVGR